MEGGGGPSPAEAEVVEDGTGLSEVLHIGGVVEEVEDGELEFVRQAEDAAPCLGSRLHREVGGEAV